MPFRPQSLPYKLRALFDAKVCTPQDISRATGLSLISIDRIVRGWIPSQQARHEIDKFLAFHARKRNTFLKLELPLPDVADAAPPCPARGVYEDTEAFPGTNVFNVYRGDGVRIGRWEAPAGITDEELLLAFDGLLERKDATLHLHHDDGAGSS